MVTKVWDKSELNVNGMSVGNGGYYVGLSTDSKPSGPDVPNGFPFVEMDTAKIYLYDAANDTWYEQ